MNLGPLKEEEVSLTFQRLLHDLYGRNHGSRQASTVLEKKVRAIS